MILYISLCFILVVLGKLLFIIKWNFVIDSTFYRLIVKRLIERFLVAVISLLFITY